MVKARVTAKRNVDYVRPRCTINHYHYHVKPCTREHKHLGAALTGGSSCFLLGPNVDLDNCTTEHGTVQHRDGILRLFFRGICCTTLALCDGDELARSSLIHVLLKLVPVELVWHIPKPHLFLHGEISKATALLTLPFTFAHVLAPTFAHIFAPTFAHV